MLERYIEDYLVKRVNELGGEVRKVAWPGRRGAPDRFVMLPGNNAVLATPVAVAMKDPRAVEWLTEVQRRVEGVGRSFFVELKAPNKKPDPHQLREHERMRALGQRVEVIDSIEGVDRLLGGA